MLFNFFAWGLPILLQNIGNFVVLMQAIILNIVALCCNEIPGPEDSCHKVINTHDLRLHGNFRVELLFCGSNTRPEYKPTHEFPCILGWTACTHHFKIPLPLALRFSESLRVTLIYFIRCTNLAQLSLSGDLTLVFRNAMDVWVSGIDLLVKDKVFATRLWDSTTFTWSSFLKYLYTTNILLGVVLEFRPFPFRYAFTKAVRISSM